jgi:hypothetical protein
VFKISFEKGSFVVKGVKFYQTNLNLSNVC